ncbi:MAG: tRNA pseudouridine(55) synthase TruB [Deinococcus sp.]|nr:tRNA pseudouridine(55) synthase TruB [Deinococcus sp.]
MGITSFSALARLRRTAGVRRIGHAGTLDPAASGVLVTALGDGTKLLPFLLTSPKEYLAWVSFGIATDTLDSDGVVVARAEAEVTASELGRLLPQFVGEQQQTPPRYAALKHQGQRLYALARAGQELEPAPRPVVAYSVELVAFGIRDVATTYQLEDLAGTALAPYPFPPLPTAVLRVVAGPGFYVRALAKDLGQALGVPACLSGLVRLRSGQFTLQGAVPPDAPLDTVRAALVPLAQALPYQRLVLEPGDAQRLRRGQRLKNGALGRLAVVDHTGELVAVAEGNGQELRPLRVW